MDDRQELDPKDKNIAQLMVKLVTVQAQIKLVKSAIFINKQKSAISTKIEDFKQYAEGQAEKYSQNVEEATNAIETYKDAVQEAMQQYEDNYLNTMAEQDKWQEAEILKMGEQKQISSSIKEKRKTPEYKEWKQAVNAKSREIKANVSNPEKLAILAEELKDLQAKDPTLQDQQNLAHSEVLLKGIRDTIQYNDDKLKELQNDRDKKLSDLLENKETSLSKIQKQNLWQKIIAKLTPKAKSFKTNVVDRIVGKANKIKNESIPEIKKNLSERQHEYRDKMSEAVKNTGTKLRDTKDLAQKTFKNGVRTVVDFGREAKKTAITTLKGIGTKVGQTKDYIKEGLRTAIENSSQALEDLNDAR